MESHVYLIRALTNLHAGSGESNFGIVDKEIQYDSVTGYPTVHASGVKGAIREYFEGAVSPAAAKSIFGDNDAKGKVIFHSADFVALPVYADDKPYELSYSADYLKSLCDRIKVFAAKDIFSYLETQILKDAKARKTVDTKYDINDLPVIARNNLENGKSTNLWYERFVPREALFVTLFQSDDVNELQNLSNAINGKVVQLGGNATVGYGYCLFTKID